MTHRPAEEPLAGAVGPVGPVSTLDSGPSLLLVAWAVGLFAESGRYIWDGSHTTGRVALSVTLVAAVVLAAVHWSWERLQART